MLKNKILQTPWAALRWFLHASWLRDADASEGKCIEALANGLPHRLSFINSTSEKPVHCSKMTLSVTVCYRGRLQYTFILRNPMYVYERPPKPPTIRNSYTRTLILDAIMKLSGTIGVTQKTMTLDTHVCLIFEFEDIHPAR